MGTPGTCRQNLPHFEDRLALGPHGLRVGPFCIGHVGSPDTIEAAFEAGINFFFISSDLHWPWYEGTRQGVRQLLKRRPASRDQIVVAGVSYLMAPLTEHCLPFRELLQEIPELQRIDVLIAGAAYGKEYGERLPAYQKRRREQWLGARAIGTTFHDRAAARRAIQDRAIDVAFIRYNPAHAGARKDLFPHVQSAVPAGEAAANGKGASTLLFCFNSTSAYLTSEELKEMGLKEHPSWSPEITDHYRYVLTRPEVNGILMAPETPEELEGIARALARGPLTNEEESYLVDVASHLPTEWSLG
jgi:predicted aldo/keto reductase-like oxidoreductase